MLDRLLADWPLKLLSLVIAFTLWASITGEDQAVRDLDLPLAIQLGPEQIMANTPPKTVSVRLQGPRTVIRNIEPLELSVRLDLREGPTGETDVQLSERQLRGLPRRVDVQFFDPDRISLVVARRMRRELPVTPDLVGKPPTGFRVYEARVRPGKLTVEGPEGAVTSLTQLRTNPLQLEHRTRPFSESVSIVPDRPDVRIVDPRPLEVKVVVGANPVERRFDDVPILVPGGGGKRSVRPGTARVVVSGPPEIVDRLSAAQIRAVALVTESRSGADSRAAVEASVLDLPEEQMASVRVESVDPSSVTLSAETRRPSR